MKKKSIQTVLRTRAIIAPAFIFILTAAIFGCNARRNATKIDPKGEIRQFLSNRGIRAERVTDVKITSTLEEGYAPLGCALSFEASIEYEDITREIREYRSPVSEILLPEGLNLISERVILAQEGSFEITACFLNISRVFEYTITSKNPGEGNYALLVNKYAPLTREYFPHKLARPPEAYCYYPKDNDASYLEEEAAFALTEMFEAAKSQGYEFCLLSGYRSYERQGVLYERAGGQTQNDTAAPGESEHQTGLAADITWGENKGILSVSRAEDEEFFWLVENCHKYGFILRYPAEKSDITLYSFEPWHYRYIGKENAQQYHHLKSTTLEEFLGSDRTEKTLPEQ